MKRHTITDLAIRSSLALGLILALGSIVRAESAAPAAEMPMTVTQMQEHCKSMMEHKTSMAADVKAQDDALTEMVAKMNRAPGDKQMGLMAAVITQIVERQVAMDLRKAKMEEEMMTHTMQHMQMGTDPVSQCPMMKDMSKMKGMESMPVTKGMPEPGD